MANAMAGLKVNKTCLSTCVCLQGSTEFGCLQEMLGRTENPLATRVVDPVLDIFRFSNPV
jgi:hypothetical protein